MFRRTHTRFPAVLVTVLAVLAALLMAGSASAAPADDPRPIPPVPLPKLPLDVAEKALASVEALLQPKQLKRTKDGVVVRRDATMALRDLYLARPSLTGADRTRADRILAKPGALFRGASGSTASAATDSRSTTHFTIAYSVGGTDGVSATDNDHDGTPDYVQTVGRTMEEVWSAEVGRLGYKAPRMNTNGKIRIELSELSSEGLYGFCSPSSPISSNGLQTSAACGLDNNYAQSEYGIAPINSLRVTAAHEFFHAIQFNYDASEDLWFMEATAVWMEDEVYDGINDYLNYLPYSALATPQTPADYDGGYGVYGSMLFWKFLTEATGRTSLVKEAWANASATSTNSGLYSLQALTKSLAANGYDPTTLISKWGTWNTLLGRSYSEARSYPAQKMWQTAALGSTNLTTGSKFTRVSHLANAYMNIKPGSRPLSGQKLRVSVDLPSTASGVRAYVVVLYNSGYVRNYTVPLSSTGAGSLSVGFAPSSVHQAVVVLANGSTKMVNCGAGHFSCSGEGYYDNAPVTVNARVTR